MKFGGDMQSLLQQAMQQIKPVVNAPRVQGPSLPKIHVGNAFNKVMAEAMQKMPASASKAQLSSILPGAQEDRRPPKKGIKKFLHKPGKEVGKFYQHKMMPIALPLVGSMIGGPVGATAGGAISGALQGKKHVGTNMLKGAGIGLAVGSAMGLGNLATGGTFMGGGIPGVHGAAGAGSASGAPGLYSGAMGPSLAGHGAAGAGTAGTGLYSGAIGPSLAGQGAGAAASGGGLSGILGGLGGGGSLLGGLTAGNLLDAGLLGTAIIGGLGSRTRPDKRENEAYERFKAQHGIGRYRGSPYMSGHDQSNYPRFHRTPNPHYGRDINPDEDVYFPEAFHNNALPFAHGGYVHGGYINGSSGGQDDKVDLHIPEGAYVMDATTTALLGDGNSENGHEKIEEIKRDSGYLPYSAWNPHYKKVRVKLSSGEDVIEPEAVEAIGDGDAKKGVKKLDHLRKKLRKEKGMTKFLPPKTKSVKKYLG